MTDSDSRGLWEAPFSEVQVRALNEFQQSGRMHPYTCGNDSSHPVLVASVTGWSCSACDYKQTWAHAWHQSLRKPSLETWPADVPIPMSIWEDGFTKVREGLEAEIARLRQELDEAQKQADYWKGRAEAEWLEADKRGMERIREHVAETRLATAEAELAHHCSLATVNSGPQPEATFDGTITTGPADELHEPKETP